MGRTRQLAHNMLDQAWAEACACAALLESVSKDLKDDLEQQMKEPRSLHRDFPDIDKRLNPARAHENLQLSLGKVRALTGLLRYGEVDGE